MLLVDFCPAFIYANQGALFYGNAEFYLHEVYLFAVEWDCVCFSVDNRKAPEYEAPKMQNDLCEAIEYIHKN